ncbi:hypothetical protein DPMN_139374 [Dreissena polymorpha]|uniref:Uncharacterized protein n=1 Tax=Dreissena polymorpha TaxID=45954 RepID=A0A9D4G8G3_DREPO|nr:hypothetical protein DPMN_139374 [Dreissena polymorpha]
MIPGVTDFDPRTLMGDTVTSPNRLRHRFNRGGVDLKANLHAELSFLALTYTSAKGSACHIALKLAFRNEPSSWREEAVIRPLYDGSNCRGSHIDDRGCTYHTSFHDDISLSNGKGCTYDKGCNYDDKGCTGDKIIIACKGSIRDEGCSDDKGCTYDKNCNEDNGCN